MNINCPCNSYLDKSTILCNICKKFQHKLCVIGQLNMRNYICQSCQIDKMDPFIKIENKLASIILLKYKNKNFSPSKATLSFTISNEIKSKISEYNNKLIIDKDINNYNPSKNPLYIALRCLRLDSFGYEHHWPSNSKIFLNNNLLKENKLLKDTPLSKQRRDYPLIFYLNKSDRDYNIHRYSLDYMFNYYDYLNELDINHFNILNNNFLNDNDKFSYVISLDLIKILSYNDVLINTKIIDEYELIHKIIYNNFKYNTKFYKNFSESKDVFVKKERISLIDIISGKKITNPVRSYNCTHLAVFDLEKFLYNNIKSKKFDCPICKVKVKANYLYIDNNIKNFIIKYPDSNIATFINNKITLNQEDNFLDNEYNNFDFENNINNKNYLNKIPIICDYNLISNCDTDKFKNIKNFSKISPIQQAKIESFDENINLNNSINVTNNLNITSSTGNTIQNISLIEGDNIETNNEIFLISHNHCNLNNDLYDKKIDNFNCLIKDNHSFNSKLKYFLKHKSTYKKYFNNELNNNNISFNESTILLSLKDNSFFKNIKKNKNNKLKFVYNNKNCISFNDKKISFYSYKNYIDSSFENYNKIEIIKNYINWISN